MVPLFDEVALPDAAKLFGELQKTLAFDGAGTFSRYVADALTGQELFSQDGESTRTPASNLKLLTAGAVLKTLGPDARFSTRAIAGADSDDIVLQGGDSMLSAGESAQDLAMGRAGVATLASDTAVALAASGTAGTVTISIEDTLFTARRSTPHGLRKMLLSARSPRFSPWPCTRDGQALAS